MKKIKGDGRKPVIDLTGQRFGRLVVLGIGPKLGRKLRWYARCDCGTEKLIHGEAMRYGLSRSCGCARRIEAAERRTSRAPKPRDPRRHGLSNTRAHRHWKAAKQRCFDPNAANYRHYGGRGIGMAPEWASSFETFYRDMGECPAGHSLERDDFNDDYRPGNCRWATQAEQVRNTSRNIIVEHAGQRMCLKDYASAVGVGCNGLRYRIHQCGEDAHTATKRLIERQRHRQSKSPAVAPAT